MGDQRPTLEYASPRPPIVTDHRTSRIGTLISTVNAFLGVVLIPAGLLYLGDFWQVGCAWAAAGLLLCFATLKYIAAERQRFGLALVANSLGILLLSFVYWSANGRHFEDESVRVEFS